LLRIHTELQGSPQARSETLDPAIIAIMKRSKLNLKTPAVMTNSLKGNGGGKRVATRTDSMS
jgi:hypothetical protein